MADICHQVTLQREARVEKWGSNHRHINAHLLIYRITQVWRSVSEIRVWHYVLSHLLVQQHSSWEPGKDALGTCVQPSALLRQTNGTEQFVEWLCQIIDFGNDALCQLLTTAAENVMKWEELQCNTVVNHLILIFAAAKSEINASGSRDKESFNRTLSNSLALMNVV